MKSEKLSEILHDIVELIKYYPGKDISFILSDLRKIKLGEITKLEEHKKLNTADKHKIVKDINSEIDRFHKDLDSFSIQEIDKKLNSEELFASMSHIKYFASKLGLDFSTRQSKANSIHTIKNHIDRMRIDSTISNRHD